MSCHAYVELYIFPGASMSEGAWATIREHFGKTRKLKDAGTALTPARLPINASIAGAIIGIINISTPFVVASTPIQVQVWLVMAGTG